MLFRQLFDPPTSTYTYLVADPKTRQAALIDPVQRQVERDLTLLSELGLSLTWILDTHVHADHITGSGALRQATGAKIGLSAATGVENADQALGHRETLKLGEVEIECRATPGHTDGCMTFVARDQATTLAMTGDALLIRGCGRTDFQQGDAGKLYDSIHQEVFSLPDDTPLYPGHDYRGLMSTTVGEEKAHNRRLNTDVDKAAFIDIMNNLKLDAPARIKVAVPANLHCGHPDLGKNPAMATVRPKHVDLDRYDRVVDVRSEAEFFGELGHIDGAQLVPLETVGHVATEWKPSENLLLVCRGGTRSQLACERLIALGFESVTNLEGGMQEWNRTRGRQ